MGVVEWDPEAVAHMWENHKVTSAEAEQALDDPAAVVQSPDPASKSGMSDRYIGHTTNGRLLVAIVVRYQGMLYGGNAWDANQTHQHIYEEGQADD